MAALVEQPILEPINAGIVGKQTVTWKYGIVSELVMAKLYTTNVKNVSVSLFFKWIKKITQGTINYVFFSIEPTFYLLSQSHNNGEGEAKSTTFRYLTASVQKSNHRM